MVGPNFLRSIRLDGFLSFPPDSDPIELGPLNVLIGPNGSGKSNLIEAVELLHAAPTAFADAIRTGGSIQEWLWKGEKATRPASIEAVIDASPDPDLRYRLVFAASGHRTEVIDEAIEQAEKRLPNERDVYFYYRFQQGHPALNVRTIHGERERRALRREDFKPDESVLSQRKDPDSYPEVTWLGRQFERIQTFREWTFGRSAPLRGPQRADLLGDQLDPYSHNLTFVLNELEHTDAGGEFNRVLKQFLPRFQRFSTRIQGGVVQLYLHEDGLQSGIPMTRLSDGTIRFMAILALLLNPAPPPLLCIEEPELGLHPDAIPLLSRLLIDASARTQILATTHSDELVSGLSECPEAVLVCEHLGGTTLRRLEPEQLAFWLEKYRLGEVWRLGEIGGNP